MVLLLFKGSRGGPTFSRGGQLFPRGGGCPNDNFYISIETHITCDFPGESGPPIPPSRSAHVSEQVDTKTADTNNMHGICHIHVGKSVLLMHSCF